MRIRTIRRNTNFFAKLLEDMNSHDQRKLEEDIHILVKRSKKIQKWRDEIALCQLLKLNSAVYLIILKFNYIW